MKCTHCGLEVPEGLVEPGTERQFCCSGCRFAFELIHQHGLDEYYDLRSRIEASSRPVTSASRQYSEYDDSTFSELYVGRSASGLSSTELYLEGVHCAACVWLVEKLPNVLEGVTEARLDYSRSVLRVAWEGEAVPLSEIARFLHSIGYPSHPYRGVAAHELARREDRRMLLRIGVAGLIAGNTMLLAFALYGGHFHGIAEEFKDLFHWISLGLSLPAVLWCASPFFKGAIGALKTRTLHMDLPIVIGILAAWLQSGVTTATGRGEVYFDTLTALVFFLLAGRYLQRRQQRAASSATELLFALTPSTARRVDATTTVEVPTAALVVGDLVSIRAGDTVPADGTVVEGESAVDRSLLTGESRPEAVSEGDEICAGSVVQGASLVVRVEASGEATRIGRLMSLLEQESQRRAPIVLLADRVSGWFVAAVLTLALLTFVAWLSIDPQRAVANAVALLIVSCPCALALATPLAVSSAIGQAAQAGILVKGGEALELLARPGRMILDKTGTLTRGQVALVQWHGDPSVKNPVAALESHSSHPVALAITSAIEFDPSVVVEHPEEVRGAGISGRVNGEELVIASPSHASRLHGAFPPEIEQAIEACVNGELTPVVVIRDGSAVAVAGLGDAIREEALEILEDMRTRGWAVELLSGDDPRVADAVAKHLRIPPQNAHGAISPEEKVQAVRNASEQGTAIMVGDGVNDAAALAAASVGIAVAGGTEAAATAADVSMRESGLEPVARLLEGAERTRHVILRNFALSLAYNVVAVGLAVTGHMQPLLAAILMPISSLTVVVSSYRARMFKT